MTTTTTPPSPTTPTRKELISYLSWSALIVCPIIILLPPRKLDIYTIGLLTTTFIGGNEVSKQHTGVSMVERMTARASSFTETSLPPKAVEMQRRIREEKEGRERERVRLGALEPVSLHGNGKKGEGEGGVIAEVERVKREEEKKRGVLERVWMGQEGEDWKAKRDRREKEALEEGRGYGGLIVDQIWEVWNWGKEKNEEVKEIDEKVVAERKRSEEERER